MRKLLVIISCLFVTLFMGLLWFWYFPEDNTIVEKNNLTYYHEKDAGLTVVLFKEPINFYIQSQVTQTISEASRIHGYKVAINGSYFTPTYKHAGLLYNNNTTTVPLARLDHQLSAVVLAASTSLQFVPVSEFTTNMLASTTLAFQTGPLVIAKNVIAADSINESLNGNGEYMRTLLGKTENDQAFFVIVSARKTLPDIAAKLLSLKLFANDTISVVNLDGGPSTALFVRDRPELNFREAKYLPIIIGIR